MSPDLESVRRTIREKSPLTSEATEAILRTHFAHPPRRTLTALAHWPLERSRVLDVGCGYGKSLLHFGPGSLGLDNSEECIAICRLLGLDARLVDVESPDGLASVPDEAFDYIWVSDLLEHVDAPRLLLRRLTPKLAPGGTLLVQVSLLPRPAARWLLRRLAERPFDAEVHYFQWTRETVVHLLARAGFRTRLVVPLLPSRLERLTRLVPGSVASRAVLEAHPDAELTAATERAEERNRRPVYRCADRDAATR